MPITCFYFDATSSTLANNLVIWREALLQGRRIRLALQVVG